MSPQTSIVAFVTLAVAITLVRSATIRTVDIGEAYNKTVCPMEVDYDVDLDRIPQRIKIIKCAKDSLHWCRAQQIPDSECCHHNHNHRVMECVELRDVVLVFYKNRDEPATFEVPVGCSCMVSRAADVSSLN